MNSQKPLMKPTRKQVVYREFRHALKERASGIRFNEPAYLEMCNEAAARRLNQLGGLAARW
ncbi:hypothetical protein [Burkholderia ubonensis]|uniref:hypothetical protein n=1 Tax=Burkholderia ubonensis TaxID=101571 RepID=UPI0007599C68|nr:hypothetical protein [Burkholderia ubonensis]KVU46950.1 hypothetical protein WK68_34445 [Burkholderia ubonensis]